MSDWRQAQNQQWEKSNSENLSEEYSDEDDDYEPIATTTWGSQSVAADGSLNVSISVADWGSLVDPNVQTKAGGVGSGQLHRRGANFKPVGEQMILAQRLGKPVPGGLGGGGKKKKPKGPKSTARAPPPKKNTPSTLPPPSSSTYRAREVPTAGPWGSAQLASTPFWESSANNAGRGSSASKYAPAPPNNPSRPPASAPAAAASFQFKQPERTAADVAPSRPIQTAAPPGFINPALGSAASKYAVPAVVVSAPQQQQYQTQQYQPQPQQYQSQPQQPQPQQYQSQPQQPQPQPQPAQQILQFSGNDVRTVHRTIEQPVIRMNIEVMQGKVVVFNIYAKEEPENAAKRLETEHGLLFDIYQRLQVIATIQNLLEQYNQSKLQ